MVCFESWWFNESVMDRMYVKGGTSLTPMLSISNHLWWSTGSTLSQHTECKLLCLFTVQWRIQGISSRTDPLFCQFFAKKRTMKSIKKFPVWVGRLYIRQYCWLYSEWSLVFSNYSYLLYILLYWEVALVCLQVLHVWEIIRVGNHS